MSSSRITVTALAIVNPAGEAERSQTGDAMATSHAARGVGA
jgi:hypothetical protein